MKFTNRQLNLDSIDALRDLDKGYVHSDKYLNVVPGVVMAAISAIKQLASIAGKVQEALKKAGITPENIIKKYPFLVPGSAVLLEYAKQNSKENIDLSWQQAVIDPKSFLESNMVTSKLWVIAAITNILEDPSLLDTKFTTNEITDHSPIMLFSIINQRIPISKDLAIVKNTWPDSYNYLLAAIYSVFTYFETLSKAEFDNLKIIPSGNAGYAYNSKSYTYNLKTLINNNILQPFLSHSVNTTVASTKIATQTGVSQKPSVPDPKYKSFWDWLKNSTKVTYNIIKSKL